MTDLLEVDALAVRYGAMPALHRVSLRVRAGEAVALLGANGAGKTTLMKAVIGLLRPAAGRIRFDGHAMGATRPERRARLGIGYCPEGRRVFPGLTVRENLLVACWAGAAERARRVSEAFALFPGLEPRANDWAWKLSGGQQQMLAIARSMMGRPRLLLLDEPSLGLSPGLAEQVMTRIPLIVAAGAAVLLAEQNATKALAACNRAWVLRAGAVAAHGPAAELAHSPELKRALLAE